MEGEIILESASGESSTANESTRESSTPNPWVPIDEDNGEPWINSAANLLLYNNGNAGRESSILSRLRLTMFHQLKHTEFTQQELPAWKPIITPTWTMAIFIAVTLFTILLGIITLAASHHVVEIVHRYDVECMNQTLIDPVSFIQSPTVDHRCNITLVIPKLMKHPVFVFYQLTRFHQNHRRYMKSRSTKQHQGNDVASVASCHPVARLSNSEPIVPCGLMAWSMFNDTYNFHIVNTTSVYPIHVVQTGIAWESDARVQFSSNVYPQNFPNNVDQKDESRRTRFPVGGASLDPRLPLSQDENLMVWMRPAPLPRFRKLYGSIQRNLHAGQVIQVGVENVYNTYSFKGSKSLVLSTTSFLGGKNHFLGRAYLSMGALSAGMTLVTIIVHLHHPRPLGDHLRLTWNCHSRSEAPFTAGPCRL